LSGCLRGCGTGPARRRVRRARSSKIPGPTQSAGRGRSAGVFEPLMPPMSEVTRILNAIEQGDRQAASQLLPLVYEEPRRLAPQRVARETPGQPLDATALVQGASLRLVGRGEQQLWDSRGHFFAAEAMRRILVESARRKRSHKHGGDRARQQLDPPT